MTQEKKPLNEAPQLTIPKLLTPRHRPTMLGKAGSLTRQVLAFVRGPKRVTMAFLAVLALMGSSQYGLTRLFNPSANGQLSGRQVSEQGAASQGDRTAGTADERRANRQSANRQSSAGADTTASGRRSPEGLPQVSVQTARLATTESSLTLTGTVVPENLLRVAPSLGGLKITEMRVQPGDRVGAGQVIAVLDNSLLLAQRSQAEARLTQAETAVRRQNATLAQAQVLEKAAATEVGRYSTLYEQGAISQQQL